MKPLFLRAPFLALCLVPTGVSPAGAESARRQTVRVGAFDFYPDIFKAQDALTAPWPMRALIALAALSAIAAVTVLLLRRQLRLKTLEISARADERDEIEVTLLSHLEDMQFKDFIIENFRDAVYWILPDGSIWDVNRAASGMLGYSREQLLTMALPDIDPNCPREILTVHWEKLKREGSLQLESAHRTERGELIPVEVTAYYCSYNKLEYNCTIVREIAERKKMEQALEQRLLQQARHLAERQRSEELLLEYRKVIECSRNMICVVDCGYRFLLANGAFLGTWRKSLDQVVGRTVAEVLGGYPFAQIKHHLDRSFSGVSADFEMRHEDPELGVRSLAVSCTPIAETGGGFRLALAIVDQTEKRQLEAQLRQSQKMEGIGLLAGGIAHDFNNILTVIMGYSSIMVLDGTLDELHKGKARQIIAATERATELTRGLLAFSRKQILAPRELNLNDIVQQTQKFLLRIIGEDIELKFSTPQEVIRVFADSSQIEQVLVNLATNARDAMPRGGTLAVDTRCLEIDGAFVHAHGYGEPGRYACLSVADSGEGMSRETRERIFEPFFSSNEPGKGTGLGLAVVYGIVKQHKGFVHVQSEPGQGAIFRIYLPLAEREAGSVAELAACRPPEGGGETILVAEDDANVAMLVESVLQSFGYTVILAKDGRECVEKFKADRDRIRLVVMDMIMPGKSGREAFREIAALQAGVRVLYSSGHTADFIKSPGATDDGVDLIMKPVSPSALLQKIREILDRPVYAEVGNG